MKTLLTFIIAMICAFQVFAQKSEPLDTAQFSSPEQALLGTLLYRMAEKNENVSAAQTTKLKPWQKAAIVTRFASEVKYNFAGYDRFSQDYDSICQSELPTIVATESDEEFGRKIQLFANRLGDGHTSISIDADVAYAPILQKRIDNKVFVTEVFSDEYTVKGVKRGTEIIAINDVPIIEYANKFVVPYIASSTPQWSVTYPFNSINLTKGYRGEPIKLTFRNAGGKSFDIIDNRQSPWGIAQTDMSIKFESLCGNIGLLTIPSFQKGDFNPNRLLELADTIFASDGLIIDIRNNTGGNSGYGELVMKLLATDTIPQASWRTPKYEAAYASWNRPWETIEIPSDSIIPIHFQHPQIPQYDKPIVLLVSGNTFSAAEDFTVLFKNANRGIVMGTPTAGSTGNPIRFDLGWGYWGHICTRYEKLADGKEFIGIGIQPDIIIEETEDVIFGKDNLIEAALQKLKE